MGQKPPEPPPEFDFATPASILEATDTILSNTTALHNWLAQNISSQTATFETVVRPIIDDANCAACHLRILGTLLSSVSPNASLRDASREAEKRISAAEDANLMRRDIAVLVAAVFEREQEQRSAEHPNLDRQDLHLLRRLHGQYARSGAAIQDEPKIARLAELRAELKELCLASVKTMTDADDGMWFTRDELQGLSATALADLKMVKSVDGDETRDNYWIPFRSPPPILRDATRPETRRRYYITTDRRFPQNIVRLQKIIELRNEISRLLGYANHAELRMEEKMARSLIDVENSLQEIQQRLQPLRDLEIERLLLLKRCEYERENDGNILPNAEDKLYAWDWSFYAKKLREENYSLDKTKLAEYFEANHTFKEMLKIFEKLFGMEFKEIVTSVWHEDVTAYTVWNCKSQGGEFLGYLYADIFARDGKYRNAHHILIKPGFVEANGARHYPASALACSFDPPSVDRPSLLTHGEVTTMFHELGHAIHNIVSRTKYSIPHSRDFIEIPSLMLEHWTWDPDVLTSLGRHYTSLNTEQTSDETQKTRPDLEDHAKIPRSLAESVAHTKRLHQAHQMLVMVQRALFDLTIHSPVDRQAAIDMDTTTIWNTTRRDIVGLTLSDEPDDVSLKHGAFGHIFRKYDAGFLHTQSNLSNNRSKIWAEDLYAHAFANQPLNADTGRRYRHLVLEPGSSISEIEILEGFLGRKHSSEAFYTWLASGVS